MVKKQPLLRRLADEMDLPGEPVPGLPILELIGDSRLLIEFHRGIVQYSREAITARVSYGQIRICGQNLEVLQMTARQLIISGKIEDITPIREGRP